MNEVERQRDPSHVSNRKASQWRRLLKTHGLRITRDLMKRVYLEFNEWVERGGTPEAEVESLRRKFLHAPSKLKRAFGIRQMGDEVRFHWPCLIVRAVKDRPE